MPPTRGPFRDFEHGRRFRPAFVWLVVLVSVVYAGFFAFTAYELARHHEFAFRERMQDARVWRFGQDLYLL